MKKKMFLFVFVLTCVCLLFAFAACKDVDDAPSGDISGSGDTSGESEGGGIHIYPTGWMKDSEYHWRLEQYTGIEIDRDKHNCDDYGVCEVCKYDTSNGFSFEKYTDADGEAYSVVGVRVLSKKMVIPSTFKGIPVKTITGGPNTFIVGRNYIKSIVIPNSITDIRHYAFEDCIVLKNVTFEEGSQLKAIEEGAFMHCSSLESINIPKSVTRVGSFAFQSCFSLSRVVFEEDSNLNTMGYSAFSNCSNLLSVEFGKNSKLETIGQNAFKDAVKLKYIEIPDSIINVEEMAFSGCDSLEFNEYNNGLYLGNEDNPYALFVKAKNKEITWCSVNENTKAICGRAFMFCENLSSVSLPTGLKGIGEQAFSYCIKLDILEIPSSVAFVADYAFSDMSAVLLCGAESQPEGWSAKWNKSSDVLVRWGVSNVG